MQRNRTYVYCFQYAPAILWTTVLSNFLDCDNAKSDITQLPIYRKKDLSNHRTKNNRVWVSYKDGVYDITDFIASHPGGQEKIMLAAGLSVEPFWNVYQQHYNSKLPLLLLDNMRIGTLHPDDMKDEGKLDMNDPYINDPKPSALLKFHQLKPINAEPPRSVISDSWITPTSLWFVRNHHPVPDINIECYKLKIHSHKNSLSFNINDLKSKYPKYSVISSIQCGGNRRSEMSKISITAGSPWDIGAISTAKWTGAKLSDVLNSMGVTRTYADANNIKHVHFKSVDGLVASIPIRKALDIDGDVVLAYEMNGESLPRAHGYPLRLIVPGHVGVRNVKWVEEITLSKEEADGPWQRGMAYKGLPPSAKTLDGIEVEKIQSLQSQPVQSVITFPQEISVLHTGMSNTIKGYAYSGGGNGIVRVDVSIDNGKTWGTATLTEGSDQPMDKAWAWTFWEYDITIPDDFAADQIEIICKAVDASYNVQPESIHGIWNLRGINNNAWHRVTVNVERE